MTTESGYVQSNSGDYDREHAIDLPKFTEFVRETQPKVFEALCLSEDGARRTKFLHRLQGEIAKRGVIDVLRKGVKDGPVRLDLFYGRSHQFDRTISRNLTGPVASPVSDF